MPVSNKPVEEIIQAGTTSLVTQRPEVPSAGALRTQRLSPDEARAVIDLWQAERMEQTGLTDRPAVPDVAEGLDLSVEDVQRLLAEVRTRREAEARLLAYEQELAKTWLAEEKRKLAEIQRQRAELRRNQHTLSQPFVPQHSAEREIDLVSVSRKPLLTRQQRKAHAKESQKRASQRTTAFLFLLLAFFLWLLNAITQSMPLRSAFAPRAVRVRNAVSPDPAPSGCGPGMYPFPGHDPSYGCTNAAPISRNDK